MATTTVDAKKIVYGADDALALAAEVSHIYVVKGQNVVRLNMQRDPPDEETLKGLLLGPTGNLRAPTLRVGQRLIVGFNAELYAELLG